MLLTMILVAGFGGAALVTGLHLPGGPSENPQIDTVMREVATVMPAGPAPMTSKL